MNGSTRVRCDDYPIYRYSDLLLMLAEAKSAFGVRIPVYRDKPGCVSVRLVMRMMLQQWGFPKSGN